MSLKKTGNKVGKAKRPCGFAAMDRKLVSEIARKGGKAVHSAGTAHEYTSEEARVAGRKGGLAKWYNLGRKHERRRILKRLNIEIYFLASAISVSTLPSSMKARASEKLFSLKVFRDFITELKIK